MFDLVGRIPGLDPATGTLALPLWAAQVAVGLFVILCLLAFGRKLVAGYRRLRALLVSLCQLVFGRTGLARITLVLIGAAVTWFVLDASSRRDLAVERRQLDARVLDLTARALVPGSALACLDAGAGDTVEASCENALFATPETVAAAVSYVSVQLTLLADLSNFARRADTSFNPTLTNLRHAVEIDRFGIVAHVLAFRDGCKADQCGAFALFNNASHVSANLAQRTYDFYVLRHAAGWPAVAKTPMASLSPPPTVAALPPPAAAPATGRPLPANYFLPSAASIPPINIMTAEPSAPAPETTSGAVPAAKPQPPQRKPAPAPAQKPVNLNAAAAARAAAPAPSAQ